MSLEDKIRDFGQKRDIEGLEEYLSNITLDELLNLVQKRLTNSNFTYTWNYILQGLTDTSDSHKKRFEIVMKVLRELEKSDFPSSHSNAIIRRICMDLLKFKNEHLLNLCDFCIECLQSQRVSQMSWKELLPELLNTISERDQITYHDEDMTGSDYKHQLINSICMLQWFPSNVTSLAEMFIDMSLTKEEHQQVVSILGNYLEKLTPQEIPAFVYQLLRLCKQHNGRIIFMKLQQYFGLRYDTLLNQTDSNSDNTEMDVIEDTSTQDIIEAESTVLFHIHTSASLGQECVKEYLNFLKNMLRSPEMIIHPFQLSILLTLSTIPHYEEKVFEIIRSCISRTYHEEQKKSASAWFRDMVPNTNSIETVFGQVIEASAQDRDLILQGLVNFAFVLLGVGSALGRDPIAEKQWQLGSMILFKIIKRKRHTASCIIEQLSNRIITENTVAQYIECLYMMSKNMSLLMIENKSIIVSLMEGLLQMPANNAKQLLDAIIPLTKVSPTIRDHFILLLRKALYSRVTETRQVAVLGFLKLLTNLKISNLAILSQSSSGSSFASGHSLFTQLSLRASQPASSAFSNEALCIEILTTLKRCFMQQAEVRIQLYAGLYNAVCLNPEIGISVLEMLWMHFRDFYNIDESVLPPLKFEKITVTRDVSVFLQEPLGNLIYTISLIVTNVSKVDAESPTVVKFINILESICARMISCELIHFELDDGTDLTDIMPEAQHKFLILKEAMAVYEALIGYKFHSWELESENQGTIIYNLFQGYCRLSHFFKNLNKPKKIDKKKKDANKTTQQTNNTTIKKDGQKSTKNLKMPDTILNFPVMIKIMNLLHEPMVSWTTIGECNKLKSQRNFHQHMMQAVFNLISTLKNKKVIDVQVAKINYDFLCDIATLLYSRIIKRLKDFIDFDCTTAVLAAECFLSILNIIVNNYRSNFQLFLVKVGSGDSSEDLVSLLSEFIKVYQKLFDVEDEELSEDPEIKKLALVVINTLNFLANQIPNTNNTLALQTMEWLKNYAMNNEIKNRQTAQGFVNLLFDFHIKFKVTLNLFDQISSWIGTITGVINEDDQTHEEFKVINELTVNNIFISFCNCIKSLLEDVEWIIARLKAEYAMLNYLSVESLDRRQEKLKTRERGVCCQLCFLVTILTNLSNCTIPTGNLSEAALKNLSLLYCTLSSLARYFILRSSKVNPAFQAARFERLVKLSGKQLAPVIYRLITFIEESQKQEAESPQKKKKKTIDGSSLKSKVLKETRLIPKVIYEMEQFSKFVMQISKKTQIDLLKFIGQGTVRDFRILHLNEVLEQVNDGAPVPTQESDISLVGNEDDENMSDEVSPPPSKKRNTQVTDD